MIWKWTGLICLILLGWSWIYITGIGVGLGGGRSLQVDRKMNIKFLDYLFFLLGQDVGLALDITWTHQHLALLSRERAEEMKGLSQK